MGCSTLANNVYLIEESLEFWTRYQLLLVSAPNVFMCITAVRVGEFKD